MKRMTRTIRNWRIQRSAANIEELSRRYNATLRGWIAYFGKFWYRNFSYQIWSTMQSRLLKWAKNKYRLSHRRAEHRLRLIRREKPSLFAHWSLLRAVNG